MIIWILGKSGSGKSTLAKALKKSKKLNKKNWIHIDGDIIRKIFNDTIDYSITNRKKNASRISNLVKFLSDRNLNIIVSSLTNFQYWLNWNRKNLKNYFEIYLDVSMENLIQRDTKKIYKRAFQKKLKNVVGVDIKFNIPKNSDLKIDNNMNDKKLNKILSLIYENKKFLRMLENAK